MRIGDVTISKGLERESSYFWVTRPEQVVINLAEGKTFVSDSGRGLLQGVLTVRNLTGPKAYEVLDYVARVLKLQAGRFSIEPNAWDDIGAGLGVTLTDCFYNSESTEGLAMPDGAFGRYSIQLRYARWIDNETFFAVEPVLCTHIPH